MTTALTNIANVYLLPQENKTVYQSNVDGVINTSNQVALTFGTSLLSASGTTVSHEFYDASDNQLTIVYGLSIATATDTFSESNEITQSYQTDTLGKSVISSEVTGSGLSMVSGDTQGQDCASAVNESITR
ncbi:MAG: hypothetical protein B2I17_04385 [Thermoplasmatales archaeon B_DKE]|nr:MAG: hypothetical protein B2I17_04385 [Thermoplasmatales archaeon B_DKE]